jgi:hypothetical protein
MDRKLIIPEDRKSQLVKKLNIKKRKERLLKKEYEIRLAREDNNKFNEYVLLDEKGDPIKQWIGHVRWQTYIRRCWDLRLNPAIFSMWGHGKSSQIAIGTVLYELGRNTNLRVKLVCNSDENAKKRANTLKNYIAESDKLHRVFPHLRPSMNHWTSHSFDVAGKIFSEIDHSVESYGVTSTIIGGRADLIIFDDVVDNNSETSAAMRNTVLNNCDSGFMSRLEPEGKVVLIGTFWHVDDYYQEILKRPGWACLIQGVSEDFEYIEEIDMKGILK